MDELSLFAHTHKHTQKNIWTQKMFKIQKGKFKYESLRKIFKIKIDSTLNWNRLKLNNNIIF